MAILTQYAGQFIQSSVFLVVLAIFSVKSPLHSVTDFQKITGPPKLMGTASVFPQPGLLLMQ